MESKTYLFILYITLFIISQCFTLMTAFVTMPYKNLTTWEAYKMAIPFAWMGWVFLTYAISITHKYKLLGQTQTLFLIILVQFSILLLINKFYLKQAIYRSDYIAFFIVLCAYLISVFNVISKIFGIPIPENPHLITKEAKELEDENTAEKEAADLVATSTI